MRENRKKAAFYAASAGAMWGTVGLFVNVSSKYGIRSMELTVSRLVIAAAVLGVSFFIGNRKLFQVRPGDMVWFGVAGILCLLFFNVSYGIAIEKSSMSTAALLLYTSPVFVTLIAVPVLKERLSLRKLLAVILAVIGCAFVSGIMSGTVAFPADAFFWGMGAALGYAMYSIVAGMLLKRYPPLTVLFYTFLSAAIAGCFLADMENVVYSINQHPKLGAILVISAFVCNIFSYLSYNTALKHMEAGSVSVIASIEPAVASILGVAVLGEAMDFYGVAGVICILGAIAVLKKRTGGNVT